VDKIVFLGLCIVLAAIIIALAIYMKPVNNALPSATPTTTSNTFSTMSTTTTNKYSHTTAPKGELTIESGFSARINNTPYAILIIRSDIDTAIDKIFINNKPYQGKILIASGSQAKLENHVPKLKPNITWNTIELPITLKQGETVTIAIMPQTRGIIQVIIHTTSGGMYPAQIMLP